MTELIVFVTAFVAVLLSSMGGGGLAIIMIPVLLSIGLPYPLAATIVSTNSTFWVIPAAYNYLKGRKIDWPFIIICSLLGLVSSYFAVLTVISVDERILKTIVGVIILLLVAYTLFKKEFGLVEHQYPRWRQLLAYVFAPLHGFYELFFGSANGIVFSIMTYYTKGFDLVSGLGHYYAIAFSWCLFGTALLVSKGFYDWKLMLAGALGATIGGYIGSRYARYKGNKFIKTVFIVVGGLLGLKLLLGF